MKTTLIKNGTIINEGKSFKGHIVIKGEYIDKIITSDSELDNYDNVIDAEGMLVLPGVIDDQVHFREPGLTHKGNIESESTAAVAGGVTSFMEMPNTIPQTTTIEHLEEKYDIASKSSLANYSFYMGATNSNIDEVLKIDPKNVCGVKVFMGSSTGDMLVDNNEVLNKIFSEVKTLIATHCEDEETIRNNMEKFKNRYGNKFPFAYHSQIRSDEACYISSSKAVELASKHGSRLHILHISSAKELSLFDNKSPLSDKKITAEACVHHLWFHDEDYDKLGWRIKWNPSVKNIKDRDALREAVNNNIIDVVATDHAPHTLEEKQQGYFESPSGGPLVQHSLSAMLEMADQGVFSREMVVEKMCHAPATLFNIDKRGFLREGYFADIVLVNPNKNWEISDNNVLYSCKWSPFSGTSFNNLVTHTWVNGNLAYENGNIYNKIKGKRLNFNN